MNGEKVESYNKIKDNTARLVVGDDDVRKVWKEYFKDLYNVDTEE